MLSLLSCLVFAQQDIANEIFEKIPILKQDIDRLAGKLPINRRNLKGKEKLLEKIQEYIKNNKPIVFTLVGFPFKSTYAFNLVLGKKPDMAEYVSLKRLNKMCLEIQKVYKPGAKIIIYTDGVAFCKSYSISYQEVKAYEEGLKALCQNFKLITIVSPNDLTPGISYKDLDKTIQKYEPSDISKQEQMDYRSRLNQEVDESMNEETREKITLSVLKKGIAFGSWLKPYREKSILLSCHYKQDIGEKIGIALSDSVWTAWHGCAIKKRDGSFDIIPKRYAPKNTIKKIEIINRQECPFLEEK